MVARDCSDSEFELHDPYGKSPLFSRWPIIVSADEDGQSVVSRVSDIAVRGV